MQKITDTKAYVLEAVDYDRQISMASFSKKLEMAKCVQIVIGFFMQSFPYTSQRERERERKRENLGIGCISSTNTHDFDYLSVDSQCIDAHQILSLSLECSVCMEYNASQIRSEFSLTYIHEATHELTRPE